VGDEPVEADGGQERCQQAEERGEHGAHAGPPESEVQALGERPVEVGSRWLGEGEVFPIPRREPPARGAPVVVEGHVARKPHRRDAQERQEPLAKLIGGRFSKVLPAESPDVISFASPTINFVLMVEVPARFECVAAPEPDVQTRNRWEHKRLFLPADHVGLRSVPREPRGAG
jgi:hypothetical protein